MHLLSVIIEFAVVLGIMVLVHELGHFITAKLCGVRVETFSIGFGTRLFGFRHGGTDYRISALPLGGYVKMAGDTPGEAPSGDPGEFNAHPRWQRVLIALAGPTANFLLSFFLLTLVAKYHHEVDRYLTGAAVVDFVPANTAAARNGLAPGDTITSFNNVENPSWTQILEESALNLNRDLPFSFKHDGTTLQRTLHISTGDGSAELTPSSMAALGLLPRMQPGPIGVFSVSPGTPADRAGLKAGDKLLRIDALEVHSVQSLLAYLREREGAPATLHGERNGMPLTLQVTPERLDGGAGEAQYRLGFTNRMPPTEVEQLPLGQAMLTSLSENKDDSSLIVRVLKGMFTRQVSVKSLSGPVGIAQQIDMATQMGYWTLMRLMSTISLNLGIFNLLPIPILDGGMILFLAIESAMRRDLNQQIKERVYQVAFVCLIVFAAFVLFNDITKLHLGRP